MNRLIRVAIVEDHSGFRETLDKLFSATPDFKVVATCPHAESALTKIPKDGCDLVLMDINLPGLSGIDCLRELKIQMPNVRVVMLTAYDDHDNLFQSLIAGADGYLLKRATRDCLIDSLRDIVSGGAPISPKIARRMIEFFHNRKILVEADSPPVHSEESRTEDLTAREKEVLGLLADGCTPKEIATKLNISWQTVRNHIRFIYDRLHVHTRTEAILKYLGHVSTSERNKK